MELEKWVGFSDGPRTMNKFRKRNAQGINHAMGGGSVCHKQKARIWEENKNIKSKHLFGSVMDQAIAKHFTQIISFNPQNHL